VDALTAALQTPNVPWLLLASYLAGSIPFGFLIARAVAGTDVRDKGSGNIGATNVARVVGKKLGLVTLVLDALKGALPVLAVGLLAFPADQLLLLEAMAGLCAFCGHCFPVWLKFRGGKGVATGIGLLLAHVPVIALIGVVAFAAVFAFARVVSLSSMVAGLVVLVAIVALRPLDAALLPLAVMFVIMVLKHVPNIRRLMKKEELSV
jgi:glycerol-3-phosphate acyltransferase PlsY